LSSIETLVKPQLSRQAVPWHASEGFDESGGINMSGEADFFRIELAALFKRHGQKYPTALEGSQLSLAEEPWF
jgi:hypothetical protein